MCVRRTLLESASKSNNFQGSRCAWPSGSAWLSQRRQRLPHVLAQSVDDDLRVYAVNVVKTPPLEKQFTGYGIYLGNGKVITAAHVVGHWPAVTRPRVLIGGQDLPAQVLKIGSLETVDLALLSIDQSQLPASLQLRRNPLCKTFPPVRARDGRGLSRSDCGHPNLFSAIYCAPKYRASHSSLIKEEQSSGSGVFVAEQQCLLGIISQKVRKYSFRRVYGRLLASANGYAGYFVPASAIAEFIPPEYVLIFGHTKRAPYGAL